MSDIRDQVISIGSQLASIETSIGQCMLNVMQAAIHDRPGALTAAIKRAELLDDQATALVVDLRRMRRMMRP